MATKKRDIKYINKDFSELRKSLIDYTKTYFPTTYNDFSPTSPGMMFMEQAAYVGDVLSFYLDNQVQETFLQYARQTNNLYELAYMFGYKPNVTQVAQVDLDFYQQVPASASVPDFDYALNIAANSTITSTSNSDVTFLIEDAIDFSTSSSSNPTEISVYSVNGSNEPTYYLLKKTKKGISSTINSTTFSFSSPQAFSTVEINTDNIIGILDVTDSDGNKWYEVDYLGQDTVYDSIKNTNVNDPNFSSDNGDVPYLLKTKQVQRRFVTRFLDSGSLQIQFGSGIASDDDEEVIPNPNNVGLGLPFEKDKLNAAYSPTNFIFTKTYGIAPSNTTLTVRYLTGGGVVSNVPSNDLSTTGFSGNITFVNSNQPTGSVAQTIFDSFAVSNPNAADGGGDGDTVETIRQNSSLNFASQQRNVTKDDYLVRALAMPSKYGVISKAHIEPTKVTNISAGESNSILDLYVLSYNNAKQLQVASPLL
jgi:hypothetical protein